MKYFEEEKGSEGTGGTGGTVPLAEFEKLRAENEKLNSKLGEANKHARNAEKEAEAAAKAKAEAEGNYQKLYEDSEKNRMESDKNFNELRNKVASEKVNARALELATNLADGPNAKLLSTFLEKRLRYDGENVKVLDDSGNDTISSLEDLAKEFKSNPDFASLIKGSQASGSGASNSSNGGGATTMPRADFDRLDFRQQDKFIKDGGIPVD